MTQTNQWDVDTPTNTWDADDTDTQWDTEDTTTAWDSPDPEPQAGPSWDVEEEPAVPSAPGWGDSSEDSTSGWDSPSGSDAMDDYWRAAPEGAPDPEPDWDDDEDDADSGGGSVLAAPIREQSLPKKKLIAAGGGAVAILALVIGGFTLLGGDEGAAEETPAAVEETAPTEDPADELAEFDGFTAALEEALNNRDVDGYYDLFSAESQEALDKKVAEDAIAALPSGARYEVQVNDGSVAGSTGALKMTVARTQAGNSVDQSLNAELVKEGTDWKMVVTPEDQ